MTLEATFFFEESDNHIELTPADILACEDVPTLLNWYEALDNKFIDMAAQVEARRIAGTDDISWLHSVSQALAFTGIGRARIKKKLKTKGHAPQSDTELRNLRELLAGQKVDAAFGRALRLVVLKTSGGPGLISAAERLMVEIEERQRAASIEGNKK